MWKRDDAVTPIRWHSTPTGQTAPSPGRASGSLQPEAGQQRWKDVVPLGTSVVITGELHGHEDLTIDGQVEGVRRASPYDWSPTS